MRYYYLAILIPTLLIFLSACETQNASTLTVVDGAQMKVSSCYLENTETGERLCVEVKTAVNPNNDVELVCEGLANESTGFAYEAGSCATAAAVSGKCNASGHDLTTAIVFYYPQYDEASAEDYCTNLVSPYKWQINGSTVVLSHGVFAEEDLPADITLEDLVNDNIIKFESP